MIQFEEIKLQNPGILIADIPEDIWISLSKAINNTIDNKESLKKIKTHKLGVNGIAESIKLKCPAEFVNFYTAFVKEYQNYFNFYKNKTFVLDSAWINLQQKYEYRPIHMHEGFLSFVIWVKIPYTIENENNLSNMFNNNAPKTNGRFQFIYTTYSGNLLTSTLDVDSSYEGKMILFESALKHQVFPFFTSDETRISVAGNFKLPIF